MKKGPTRKHQDRVESTYGHGYGLRGWEGEAVTRRMGGGIGRMASLAAGVRKRSQTGPAIWKERMDPAFHKPHQETNVGRLGVC